MEWAERRNLSRFIEGEFQLVRFYRLSLSMLAYA